MPYWVLADLEARISKDVVRQVYDDNNFGNPDTDAIAQLQADSQSYVDGFLRAVYTIPLTPVVPGEVKRISLDVAVGYLAVRHPEYVRFDGHAMLDRARAELMDLRTGKTRLDVMGPPEPASNVGGGVSSVVGTPNFPTPPRSVFGGSMGDW